MPIEYTEDSTNSSKYLYKNQNFILKYFYFLKISYIYAEYFDHITTASLQLPWCSLRYLPSKVRASFLRKKRKKKPKPKNCALGVYVNV